MLVHKALIYSSDEEFVGGVAPILQEGLRVGDRVLAVTTPDHRALLCDRLADRGAGIDLVDSTDWYQTPSRTLHAYDEYVREHERRGRRVRLVGEPPLNGHGPLLRRAWQRLEALTNLVFAGREVSVTCPYDARALDPALLAAARRTHPALAAADGDELNPDYVDPVVFCAECDAEPLPEPTAPVTEVEFTATKLAAARAFAGRYAEQAGLPATRVTEVVLAVNEITSNAVRHGGGRGRLRTWRDDHSVVYEVHDDGNEPPDPLAGHLHPPPMPGQLQGRGLWAARQLCDLVEVRHGPGWLVRLYIDLRRGSGS